MKKAIYKQLSNTNIYFWITAWLCLVISYLFSIKHGFYEKYWDHLIYAVQLIADISIGLFSYLAFISKKEPSTKKFYFLIFLSFIPGIFANEIYNVIINVARISNITLSINKLWVIAYNIFLIIQIIAWSYLLLMNRGHNIHKTRAWLIKFPHIQSAIIIIFSFISIEIFKRTVVSDIGISGIINSVLETGLFVLISMCLARTKSSSLAYLETGFLLLIAFNLAHRFSYTTGHYFKTFDVVWLICLIIIIYGLLLSWKSKEESLRFFEQNSIHVLTSAIFITFSTFLLVVFFLIDFIISAIEMNSASMSNLLLQNIPSILIFSYLFSILTSKVVANYVSKPLEEISRRIDIVYGNESNSNIICQDKFGIVEIDALDNFILTTIDQLQAANRVKSDFLMNMSHDFRTPASGIYHVSRSIYNRMDNQKLKSLQKLVVDSSEQLMNFLDDVLDYSRLDSKKLKLNISEFNFKELVNEVILFVLAKAKEKSLDIKVQVANDVTSYIGDRLLVHRILLNLVSNAIKFTHQGSITVSVDGEKINDKSWIRMKVKDTGIGIDKQNHQTIFEPFNRIESIEIATYPGIGLGLSNINLILKQIGGTISLESSLGHGSTFTVYL